MNASAVKTDSAQRGLSAKKEGKDNGRTKESQRRESEPLAELVQRMSWAGDRPSMEGLAGGLAAMPLAGRQSALRSLQRTRGNRFVQRLAIQAKLTVGAAGDKYEQEADRVADQVMRRIESPEHVQRKENEEGGEVQAKPLAASIAPLVQRQEDHEKEETSTELDETINLKYKGPNPYDNFEMGSEFETQLSRSRNGGSQLPKSVRGQMEQGFGADFSGIRVHSGEEITQLNRKLSAQAFTHGQDIYLGEGKDNLESSQGKRLIAHELAHVVQQTRGVSVRPTSKSSPSVSFSPTIFNLQRLMSSDEAENFLHDKNTNFKNLKKFLDKLRDYDRYMQLAPLIHGKKGEDFSKRGKELLRAIEKAGQDYLGAHKKNAIKRELVGMMISQVKAEIEAIDTIAEYYDAVNFLPGRVAIREAIKILQGRRPNYPAPVPPELIGAAASQAQATADMPDIGYIERIKTGGFKWISEFGKTAALDIDDPESDFSKNLAKAKPEKRFSDLTREEKVAIRIYTSPDYRYINPSIVYSQDYLKKNLSGERVEGPNAGGFSQKSILTTAIQSEEGKRGLLQEMAREGLQHASIAMKGLKKLEKDIGEIQRGEKWTVFEYENRYKIGQTTVYGALTSLSKNPNTAKTYYNLDADDIRNGKRSILISMRVRKGCDIEEFSRYYSEDPRVSEGEVVLLPGATFMVARAEDPSQFPDQQHVLKVVLDQIK
jgi:hypothetical protein